MPDIPKADLNKLPGSLGDGLKGILPKGATGGNITPGIGGVEKMLGAAAKAALGNLPKDRLSGGIGADGLLKTKPNVLGKGAPKVPKLRK